MLFCKDIFSDLPKALSAKRIEAIVNTSKFLEMGFLLLLCLGLGLGLVFRFKGFHGCRFDGLFPKRRSVPFRPVFPCEGTWP
jgi:hypothetical protein